MTVTGDTTVVAGKTLTVGATGILNISTATSIAGNLTNNGALNATAAISGAGTITQGVNGALTIGTGGSLTAVLDASTHAGNTVSYTGAAQTVKIPTVSYYNLTLGGSAAKTMTGITTIANNLSMSGTTNLTSAADITIAGNLTVGSGTTFTTGANYALQVTGTTSVTGILALSNSGAKTLIGAVTINNTGAFTVGAGSIEFRNGLTNSSGGTVTITAPATFTTNDQALAGANAITFGSTVGISTAGKTLTNNNTGIVTVTGILTLTGGWTQGANSILYLTAVTPFSGAGTFSASATGNVVNYTAAAPHCNVVSYDTLEFTGSGVVTCAVTTVADEVVLSGTVIWTTGANLSTAILTVGTGTAFINAADYTLTVPTVAVTATGTVTNAGIMIINTSLTGNGALANTGTLHLGGLTTISILTATTTGNTVIYDKAGAQIVLPLTNGAQITYYNLSLAGSGTKTIATAITVAHNLVITSGSPVKLTAGASTANTLNINGFPKTTGSWGSSISGAAHPDDTFFDVSGAGTITPTTSTGDSTTTTTTTSSGYTPPATIPAVTLPAGCVSATGFSTITGLSCGTTTTTTTTATTSTTSTTTTEVLCPNGKTMASNCSATPATPTVAPATPATPATPAAASVAKFTKSVTTKSLKTDIKNLQTALNTIIGGGVGSVLVVDGQWGAKTTFVIKAFQKANGLTNDGKVGPKTIAKINTLLNL